MNSLAKKNTPKAINIRFEQKKFFVLLADGREVGVPYEWFWRLNQASEEERTNWRFIGDGTGIHWEEIDEDISIMGILQGQNNPTPPSDEGQ